MSTHFLALSKIRTDGGTQSRAELSDGVIDEYAQALDLLPPVTVFYDGKIYWLADGFHRFRAFERAGDQEINAVIHQGTQRNAILFSVGANAQHGLRRTNEDKRRAVLKLLNDAEWREWSDHQIAYRCAVSHTFVGSLRPAVTGNSSSERAYKTRHGTTAKMKTAGINAERRRPVKRKPPQDLQALKNKGVLPPFDPHPPELQNDHDTSGMWRSRLREMIGDIDKHLGCAPSPADRAYGLMRLDGKWRALAPHNADGEIIDEKPSEPVTVAKDEAVGSDIADVSSAALMAASSTSSDPASLVDAEQGPGAKGGETQPPGPSIISSLPSPDPAPRLPVEGAADTAGVAAPSNLSSDDWANSHEVRSAPEMPDFLRRTA